MKGRRTIERPEEIMRYRMIVTPHDLRYFLSTYLDQCYLLGRPEQLASDSRAGLHKQIPHDTEAVSLAVERTKTIPSRYEVDLEGSQHRLLAQTCLCS